MSGIKNNTPVKGPEPNSEVQGYCLLYYIKNMIKLKARDKKYLPPTKAKGDIYTMSITEKSKPVKGTDGIFVTKNGRVFFTNERCKYYYTALKRGNGYLAVHLKIDGIFKTKSIHRLVAETFLPLDNERICVNHIDGNKLNNNISNLEWCTHRENTLHWIKLKKQKTTRQP